MSARGRSASRVKRDSARGNVLIMGIAVITLLSMFGVVMVSRMIIDSNIAAHNVLGTQAFYLADSGIQVGRRYLWLGNTASVNLGTHSIGNGTVTVQVDRTTAYYEGYDAGDRENVYRITSTATVGPTTREVEELRWRGGGNDKNIMFWREAVADEF